MWFLKKVGTLKLSSVSHLKSFQLANTLPNTTKIILDMPLISDANDNFAFFCIGFHFQNHMSSQSRSSKRIFVELMVVADNAVVCF